jgi:hypothetical protein
MTTNIPKSKNDSAKLTRIQAGELDGMDRLQAQDVGMRWAINPDHLDLMAHRLQAASDCGNCLTCFMEGTLILLADGSWKKIEEFIGGEIAHTLSGFGKVLELETTTLGVARRVIGLTAGASTLYLSDDHPVWTRFSEGDDWWGTYNMNQYLSEKDLGVGSFLTRDAVALRVHTEYAHAHISGWVKTRPVYYNLPSNTPLYHLDLEQGGSYIANGFVVSSHPRDKDFENVNWSGINVPVAEISIEKLSHQ